MTLTNELKILHNKIKANQAHYDLGREAAKISALSSKDLLEKYEYLTGEDIVLCFFSCKSMPGSGTTLM